MEIVVSVCLFFMLVFGVMAVMLHSMIKSAISLAAASVALGVIMYELGAVWAALFEISVCSGLVTVIFVSAISLSNTDKNELGNLYKDKKRMGYLPIVLIISGIVLVVAALATGFSLPATAASESADFKEILWNNRQADIWGQIVVSITGAFAIVVLFKERD
jgi:NADH-quinone oxidoreductase subunit J